MVAAPAKVEARANPLVGLQVAYYLCMREPLSALSWLRQMLIRAVYFHCDWASDYAIHDMGIFTDREVAESIARQKTKETGKAWSVKELPVNGLLPEIPVRYGFYSFPGTPADYKYRNRQTEFVAVRATDLKAMEEVKTQLDQLTNDVRSG